MITVEEIQDKKAKLEEDLNDLLRSFEKETGVSVTRLKFEKETFRHWDGDRNVNITLFEVKVVVEL